jgi:hypothetical protein
MLEVAEIIRLHGAAYLARFTDRLLPSHRRALRDLEACRTPALGGHIHQCDHCGRQVYAYHSCRNRHCPKCQGRAAAEWLAAREAELLPVPYFHVVFTLPAALGVIAHQNKAKVYGLLFTAAGETLSTIAADPKHLGAEIGVTAVLHTWGQNLDHHPHVHCIVPGGGISPDGRCWARCRPGFFLPVRVLSRLFRRLFLQGLEALHAAGELRFFGALVGLDATSAFRAYLTPLRRAEWVVYAKRPFAGPAQVLAYLARYTHRVAIGNSRLIGLDDNHVSFRWKDYRYHNKNKVMRLAAAEFIRRFLMHTLPAGFHRIRYYGFAANGHRAEKLALCRKLLDIAPSRAEADDTEQSDDPVPDATLPCPCCGGRMIIVERFDAPHVSARFDSS